MFKLFKLYKNIYHYFAKIFHQNKKTIEKQDFVIFLDLYTMPLNQNSKIIILQSIYIFLLSFCMNHFFFFQKKKEKKYLIRPTLYRPHTESVLQIAKIFVTKGKRGGFHSDFYSNFFFNLLILFFKFQVCFGFIFEFMISRSSFESFKFKFNAFLVLLLVYNDNSNPEIQSDTKHNLPICID